MVKNAERVCNLLLRLVAFGATVSATVVMATSHERVNILGVLSIEAKYSTTPAFKYFVIANAIASVYGLLVMFLPRKSRLWQLVVALDMVLSMLLVSSVSAAFFTAQIGKKGNSAAEWAPICGHVHKFCDQVTAALVVGVVGLVLYMFLLFYALYTVLNPLLVHKN